MRIARVAERSAKGPPTYKCTMQPFVALCIC